MRSPSPCPRPGPPSTRRRRDEVEIAVQICGKVRTRLMIPVDLPKEGAQEYFLAKPEVQKLVDGKTIKKFVFIPGRLVNIVAI